MKRFFSKSAQDDTPHRLTERLPLFKEILGHTGQPGLSIAVLHNGKYVLKHHFGYRDVANRQIADDNTLYSIASLTKAFVAAGLGILVNQGKVTWDTTVQTVIPELDIRSDPMLTSKITIADLLSHRSGLDSFDHLWQGIHGQITPTHDDIIDITNLLPVRRSFRTALEYNNVLYSLGGIVIERLSCKPSWSDFVKTAITTPLRMLRTTADRNVHFEDDNVAIGYNVLTDGELSIAPPTELSGGSFSGGSGAMRSSLSDLSRWALSWIDGLNESTSDKSSSDEGVLREVVNIMKGHIIVNATSPGDHVYGLGWVRQSTPAKLGTISPNRSLSSPVVGENSITQRIYSHQGNFPGSTTSIYICPKAQLAVIALSNGQGHGDATDWICQDILQTMLDMSPQVDYLEEAKQGAQKYKGKYEERFLRPWREGKAEHPRPSTPAEYVGRYQLVGSRFHIDLEASSEHSMIMTVNDREAQKHCLHAYQNDIWTFLPQSFDDYLRVGYGSFSDLGALMVHFDRQDDRVVAMSSESWGSVLTLLRI